MTKLTTIYFLITLSFGILTCISSQRLFGVEITDQTFERESRNYYHPFQYWLAKCLVDIFRMILYPLLFLSMLYIEIVPRGSFSFYLGVMILCSFVCSGIGQLVSVIFNRTEYAYLAGTIIALLSCLLSGFSPTKAELNQGGFIVVFSFSRHVQSLLFRHESKLYLEGLESKDHIWGTSVEGIHQNFDFNNSENPNFWMIFIGFLVRALTFLFIYGKSEYRSGIRFHVTNLIPNIKSFFTAESCRDRPLKQQAGTAHQLAANDSYEDI
jgi:ABC-type multidrug transport system permease subunit